jgi:hypothetical protein
MDGAFGEDCLSFRHAFMTEASSAAAVRAEQRRDTTTVAVPWGGLLFGYFLLAEQEKVTSRRAAPRQVRVLRQTTSTDSSVRWNDES